MHRLQTRRSKSLFLHHHHPCCVFTTNNSTNQTHACFDTSEFDEDVCLQFLLSRMSLPHCSTNHQRIRVSGFGYLPSFTLLNSKRPGFVVVFLLRCVCMWRNTRICSYFFWHFVRFFLYDSDSVNEASRSLTQVAKYTPDIYNSYFNS